VALVEMQTGIFNQTIPTDHHRVWSAACLVSSLFGQQLVWSAGPLRGTADPKKVTPLSILAEWFRLLLICWRSGVIDISSGRILLGSKAACFGTLFFLSRSRSGHWAWYWE
jgi:hypothetical protein